MDRALTKALKCQYWLKRQWHIWQREHLLHEPVIRKLCWQCAALICKIIGALWGVSMRSTSEQWRQSKSLKQKKRTFPSNRKSHPCWTLLPPLSLTPTQIINLKSWHFQPLLQQKYLQVISTRPFAGTERADVAYFHFRDVFRGGPPPGKNISYCFHVIVRLAPSIHVSERGLFSCAEGGRFHSCTVPLSHWLGE